MSWAGTTRTGGEKDELTPQARRLLERIRQLTARQAQASKKRWDAIWWRRRELRERTGWSNRQVR